LAKWIQSGPPSPKIVAGDFNLDAFIGNELKLLEEFRSRANIKMAQPGSRQSSYSSWEPKERIDFIFYSPDWEEARYGVWSGLLASDHLPVWVQLRR
jgi:endonuclease/exonuclease/phosphatase family metal-dependent hydrolase